MKVTNQWNLVKVEKGSLKHWIQLFEAVYQLFEAVYIIIFYTSWAILGFLATSCCM